MATAVVFHSLADRLLPVRLQPAQSNTQQPQELHSYFIHHLKNCTPLYCTPLYCTSKIQFCWGISHAVAKPEILFQALLYLLLWSSVFFSLFLSSCLCKRPQPLSSILSPFSKSFYSLFSLSLSLWCSVFCKHHKRQCSLSPFFFDVFCSLGDAEQGRVHVASIVASLWSTQTLHVCLWQRQYNLPPSLISFFAFFFSLFDIFSYPPFFVSFFLYFSLFFFLREQN